MSSILDQVAALQIAADGGREAARKLGEVELHLIGLRAGLAGEPTPECTTDAIEKGREEGQALRISLQERPSIINLLEMLGLQFNRNSSPYGLASHMADEIRRLRADGASLRQEREDWRTASLNIRRQLAPLLGCHVDNEPADSMVGRFVGVYDEMYGAMLSAEQRGHDKAMEWAAVLAGDFDPFDPGWTVEQEHAGERALELFAEKLRREKVSCPPDITYGPFVCTEIPNAPPETVAQHLYRGTEHKPGDAPVATRYRKVDGSWGEWVQTGKAEAGAVGHVADVLLDHKGIQCPTCGRMIWVGDTTMDADGPHTCGKALDPQAPVTSSPMGVGGLSTSPLSPGELAEVRAMLRGKA